MIKKLTDNILAVMTGIIVCWSKIQKYRNDEKDMISKLKWKNFNALGNLELDFLKSDETVYNTIVLAGENGTGKTTILDTLASYLNKNSIKPFEYIDYIVGGIKYHIIPNDKYAYNGFHTRTNTRTGKVETVHTGRGSSEAFINEDVEDLRHYGFAYSKARSGFNTQRVQVVTTQQVDREKYEPDMQEDFTRVKQLLIDIEGQDSSEWFKQSETGGLSDVKYEAFKKQSKGYRFEKAFNNFFDDIKYVGVDHDDLQEKKVLFEKHGNRISVDQLSTGEKQIVFRGAHLLKNIKSIAEGIVLIDEPELSMHPLWQKKILDYYRGLFVNDGVQTVQMIVATHSEYVIQSAFKDRGNVLMIVLTDENGIIKAKSITAPFVLPSNTIAETNYLAFGVSSTDYHIELYGQLQTKTGKHRIEDCDFYITQQPQYVKTLHEKLDNSYPGHHYQTLPTYIRNAIDHPDSGRFYTESELKTSIELLIELCK